MKKFIFIIACFMALTVMAGCYVEVGGKKVVEFNNGERNTESGSGSESSRDESVSEEVGGIEALKFENEVGDIKLQKTDGTSLKVKLVKKVRSMDVNVKNEILDNIEIKITKEGKEVNIEPRTKDGKNFWDWKKSKHKWTNVTLEYTMEIPTNITGFDIKSGVGKVRAQGLEGILSVNNGTGDINIDNFVFKGKSSVHSGTGSVRVDGEVNGAEELEINNGIGNINVRIPQDSKVSLDSSIGIGNLSGSFLNERKTFSGSIKRDFNGGGTRLRVNNGTGNITIDKK